MPQCEHRAASVYRARRTLTTMSQLHADPLSVLATECDKQTSEAATEKWVEAGLSTQNSTIETIVQSSREAGDSSSLEPKLGVFSALSGAKEKPQGASQQHLGRLGHHLEMRTLSPTSPDVIRTDQNMYDGARVAREITHPASISPPQPMRTASPDTTWLPSATAEISRPESPCNGATTTTGVVRGRITIPPRILASQVSENSPRTMARGRSLPTNRKQQGTQSPWCFTLL